MKIDSTAFKNGETIPQKYTCMGEGVSPPLAFHDAPKETKSFALIVDDPDAPMGTFVHWLAWNIPASSHHLPEAVAMASQGINQGVNGFYEICYKGPCPPPGGPHRYFFKLYALDKELSLPNGSFVEELESALKGHVLAQAELMGTFQR